jgi:hypothetical protein
MNVLSYLMYNSTLTPPESQKDSSRLSLYTIYSVGMTSTISVATAVTEFTPNESILKPDFGLRKCFFDEDKQVSALVFFYLPLLLSLLCSIVLFILTLFRMSKNRFETDNLGFKDHFLTAVKLYVILGINWIFEFISFIAGKKKLIDKFF